MAMMEGPGHSLSEIPLAQFDNLSTATTTNKANSIHAILDDEEVEDGWLRILSYPNSNAPLATAAAQNDKRCATAKQVIIDNKAVFITVTAHHEMVQLHVSSSCGESSVLSIGLHRLTKFDTPIRASVFITGKEEYTHLRLLLVDSLANILSFFVPLESSGRVQAPLRAVVVDTEDLLSSSCNLYVTPGIPLTASGVDFLSSSQVLLTLPPHLISVDLDSRVVLPWNAECKTSVSASSMRSIWSEAKGLLLAQESAKEKTATLPNTAALTVSGNAAFTLHADGTIRIWTLSPTTRTPTSVKLVNVPQHVLPRPHLWSHAQDSLLLQSFSDEEGYSLAIAITTHPMTTSTADRVNIYHPTQHLAIVSSKRLESEEQYCKLRVPSNTMQIVDVKVIHPTFLQTLSLVSSSSSDLPTVTLSTYTPYNDTYVLQSFPTKSINDALIAQYTFMSKSLLPYSEKEDNTKNVAALESQAMQIVFQQLRPHSSSIAKAFQKLIPSYTPSSSKTLALQMHTLQTMREWIQKEDSPQTTTTTTQALVVAPTTTDVYHAFVTKDAATPSQLPSQPIIPPTKQSVLSKTHHYWMKFLHTICKEESNLCKPLGLASIPISRMKPVRQMDTEAIILRANQSTALLHIASPPPSPALPFGTNAARLDLIALKLLHDLRSNDSMQGTTTISSLESSVDRIISTASLLLDLSWKKLLPQQLGSLGATAMSFSTSNDDRSVASCEEIASILLSMDTNAIMTWMTTSYAAVEPHVQSKLSPGFCSDHSNDPYHRQHFPYHHDPEDNVNASTLYLIRQHLQSACDLYLARSLLVFGMHTMDTTFGSKVPSQDYSILGMYLHALALRWVSNQTVSRSKPQQHQAASSLAGVQKVGGGTTNTRMRIQHFPGASPTSSPPESRARFTNTSSSSSSSLRDVGTTTVLDAHLSYFIKSTNLLTNGDSLGYLSCPAVFFANQFVQMILPMGCSTTQGNVGGGGMELPELVLLQYPSSDLQESSSTSSSSLAQARLGLRLLAPYIVYPPYQSGKSAMASNLCRIRREKAAECLFRETAFASQNQIWDCQKIALIRSHASTLLLPLQEQQCDDDDNDDIVNEKEEDEMMMTQIESAENPLDNVEAAFHLLRNGRDDWATLDCVQPPIDAMLEQNLASCLQCLLFIDSDETYTGQEAPSDDIIRLSKILTVQSLFLPWVQSYIEHTGNSCDFAVFLSKTFYPGALEQIRILTHVLLKMSDLMHRVSVVERHTAAAAIGTNRSSKTSSILGCKLILSCVQDVIATVTRDLPSSMYLAMPEYATLWSAEFRHALNGKEWDSAHRACFKNPIKERKMNNYRRLVLGMVDAGALGDLLRLCLTIVEGGSTDTDGDTGNNIDLYEFAAETLAGVAYEQALGDGRYEEGAPDSSSVAKPTNYAGCLYALHASRGDWRRASQAMDAYGLTSHAAWKASSQATSSDSDVLSSSMGGNRFMDDLSLSALGSDHAIHLVDKAHQFIVSGELAPHPFPALTDGGQSLPQQIGKKTTKRGREGAILSSTTGLESSGESGTANDEDQKSEMRSRVDRLLTAPALTRRASRNLVLRTLQMDGLSSNSINTILHASDRDIIDSLARLGYYAQAISVAKVMQAKRGDGNPNGLDLLFDSVRYILCKHVAPSAVRCLRPTPCNLSEEDRSTIDSSRPNILQLHYATVKNLSHVPAMAIGEHWRSSVVTKDLMCGKLSMELLRQYTVAYSSCLNTLALDVAAALLDLDCSRAKLPIWLTEILMGQNRPDNHGLFGNRSSGKDIDSSTVADPAGLARVYIKRGLYVEACDVMSFTLSRQGLNAVSSRLPEKGNIDYVPYQTIDMIWNIIDAAASRMKPEDRKCALDARTRMENALNRHFESTRISEEGLQSARALVPA